MNLLLEILETSPRDAAILRRWVARNGSAAWNGEFFSRSIGIEADFCSTTTITIWFACGWAH